MNTTKILANLDFSEGWAQISNIENNHGIYFMGLKGTPNPETDICDLNAVTKVVLALGVNSGLQDTPPIFIQNVVLDFTAITNIEDEKDTKTAIARVNTLPSSLYVKVVSIFDDKQEYKRLEEGTLSVSINVLPF